MAYVKYPIYIGLHHHKVWGYTVAYILYLHRVETTIKKNGRFWSISYSYEVNFSIDNYWSLPAEFTDAYHDPIMNYGTDICNKLSDKANAFDDLDPMEVVYLLYKKMKVIL